MLGRLDRGLAADAVATDGRRASDHDYAAQVCDIYADTPARHNADPRCLHEASGCAGKLAVFAVRVDSFPTEGATRTFYIGTNAPARLADLRRRILSLGGTLPIAAEYLHREAFDLADQYGKDLFAAKKRGSRSVPSRSIIRNWSLPY